MKKTTMNKWILASIALLLSISVSAQDAQTVTGSLDFFGREEQDLSKLPKMERDIIILQNVLNGLFNGNKGSFYSSTRGAKGMYVPGKGVIFNIASRNSPTETILVEQLAAAKSPNNEAVVVDGKLNDANNEETEARLKSLSGDFLVNYGSILSDLKAGEKVMLNVNYDALKKDDKNQSASTTIHNGMNIVYRGGSRLDQKRMVSSIDYSTINSYLSGKSSLEAATRKVDFDIVNRVNNEMQDAKIMAGILDDLFQSNFEGAFRRSGKTGWTYFEGFGLMYDLNIRGSYGNLIGYAVAGENTSTLRTKASKERADSDKLAEESFDKLIDMVKESLITYGRTLRSVKSDEVVIFNINFGSSFRKTKLPKAVRLQVSKSQIEEFSRGSKTISQLKKEIEIKKLSASTFSQGSHNFPGVVYQTAPEATDHIVIGTARKSNGN
ncbi:hypothetical protein [Roseivirga sp.]|uniref:hypothetical protein n=1 Tax=Roseivirga sp. TaxID=1964215 RepID=UPI003B8D5F59